MSFGLVICSSDVRCPLSCCVRRRRRKVVVVVVFSLFSWFSVQRSASSVLFVEGQGVGSAYARASVFLCLCMLHALFSNNTSALIIKILSKEKRFYNDLQYKLENCRRKG